MRKVAEGKSGKKIFRCPPLALELSEAIMDKTPILQQLSLLSYCVNSRGNKIIQALICLTDFYNPLTRKSK